MNNIIIATVNATIVLEWTSYNHNININKVLKTHRVP